MKYVLITAARNEAKNIARTIESVVAQTAKPERWIIVDDGSTDETAVIAEQSSVAHPWITVLRRPARSNRDFAGKAHAVNAGMESLADVDFEVVGNLDADVSFDADYVEFLLAKFRENPKLGVAGTPYIENGFDSRRDSFEGQNFVAGPFQLFRVSCFREIGGYVPNKAGGVDWIAVMTARMKGWEVRAYPEKCFYHHRPMGTAERHPLSATFSYGEKDYYLGGSPVWELLRVVYRMTKKPYIIDGLALLLGYGWAAVRRIERPVSPELMRYHRKNQMKKLQAVFKGLLRFKKIDNFSLTTENSD